MVAPVVVATITSFLGKKLLKDVGIGLIGGLTAAVAGNAFDSSSKEICGCLAGIDKLLREIDATLKDGFAGRNVDREGIQRKIEKAQLEKISAGMEIASTERRLAKIQAEKNEPRDFRLFGPPIGPSSESLERLAKRELAALEARQVALKARIENLQAEKEFAEIEASATLRGFDPAVLGELITILNDLTVAIGGEEGLLAGFLELDQALQSAKLPAELEALADAVAAAAARIANAVGSAPEKKAPEKKTPDGKLSTSASGGTVQPGQPVLVGERGPEIFVPSTAGAIVNAFDASADPSALGAAGSSGQIVRALEDLEETISELDETIQEAESAGLNGVGGGSSRTRSLRRRGGGTSALDEVEDFLATVESTAQAFENIERTISDFRDKAENDFEGISAAGQQAFQSILGSIQTLASNFIGGKAGRIVGVIASFARIFGFGFAGGGDLQPGVPVLVGERGPEVIVPRVPLSVKNNADTRRLLGGGTPIVVNQTVNMSADVKNTIRAEVLNAMPIAAQLATQAVAASLQGRRF